MSTAIPPQSSNRIGRSARPTPDLTNTHDRYSGSLTTPPCTEGVIWLISSEVMSVSEVGFENVRSVLGFNARFPQNALDEPNVLALALSAVPAQEEAVEDSEEE